MRAPLIAFALLTACGGADRSPDPTAEAVAAEEPPSEASPPEDTQADEAEPAGADEAPATGEDEAPAAGGGQLLRVSVQDVTVDGRRPPEDFNEMVRGAIDEPMDAVLACYREAAARDPATRGDLRLRLWVSAQEVIRVTREQHLADQALEDCAVERIYETELPPDAPRSGVSVRFLLRFAQGPRTIQPPPGVLFAEVEGRAP